MDPVKDVTLLLPPPNGAPDSPPVKLYVEARRGGEGEVATGVAQGLEKALEGIQAVGGEIARTLKAIEPDSFTVELGFEFKSEAGGLVAMLVRAGGSATVKVTMEWERDNGHAPTLLGGREE